ncbi:MAG: hypothetical protein ICV73_01290 [Acetobacteraceae bacterium]|nr:hypothetical protein [Acetobacteraceae bacterium]
MVQLGVYVGNDPADVAKFEAWLGRPVDLVAANTGERSWTDMDPEWQFRDVFLGGTDRPMLWSIPLFPQTSSLAEVAAGGGDAHFKAFAQTILANAIPSADGNIYVRTGWEVGGDMFAWSAQAKANPEAFRQAFAHFADAFHGVSDKFKIVWDAVGDRGNVTQFYPGDKYVDVVSQDFYWQPQWSSYDPAEAFEHYAGSSQGQGLNELKAFADAHGKSFAVSEWGVKADYDATGFIEAAKAWFEANDVLWATYWDSDAAYPGKMSDGTDAASGAAFKAAFGPDAKPTPTPVPTPTPTPAPTPVEVAAGAGPDALVLEISQDAWQGSAQYTVKVDGQQVGGTFTASASHAAGQSDTLTLKGDWSAGEHTVEVAFLNDAWGGTAATDRNLYVDAATYNGQAVAGAAKALMAAGAQGFAFTDAAAPAPTPTPTPTPDPLTAGAGPDSLVLKISQDAYQGSAQYTVKVDGAQVGGTFTASSLHGSGQSDTLTLKGDWGAGEHDVEVAFLNDAWGGTAATDRNLYVDGATYNGQAVSGAAQAVESDWKPGGFAFTEAAAPTPTPTPTPEARAGTDGADLFDATAAGGLFTGKGGRDLFVFDEGDGATTITDFAPGTDKLLFIDFDREDVTVAPATGGPPGLLVHYGDAGSVFLAGVSALADRDLAFG